VLPALEGPAKVAETGHEGDERLEDRNGGEPGVLTYWAIWPTMLSPPDHVQGADQKHDAGQRSLR